MRTEKFETSKYHPQIPPPLNLLSPPNPSVQDKEYLVAAKQTWEAERHGKRDGAEAVAYLPPFHNQVLFLLTLVNVNYIN